LSDNTFQLSDNYFGMGGGTQAASTADDEFVNKKIDKDNAQ
jgi:hypothetical protein